MRGPITLLLCGLITLLPGAALGSPNAESGEQRAVRRPPSTRGTAVPRASRPRSRPVYIRGYGYRPYWGSYHGFDPYFFGPYWHPYGHYGPYVFVRDQASVRLQVKPVEAEVYVDGYYVGVVDSYDGVFQRLHLPPGKYEIELYLDGYETLRETLSLVSGETYKIRRDLQPLGEGMEQVPRPQPSEALTLRPSAESGPGRERPLSGVADQFGTLAIRVQPPEAEVWIDGEPWRGYEGFDRLLVELGAGRHAVEVRLDGYRTYQTEVDVGDGDTTMLNVSLPPAE